MRALLLGGLLWLGLQGGSWADELTLKAGHPQRYTVAEGDTLWDIAQRFLEDPWLWPQLWHENPQIQNPDLIYPGDELRLLQLDGRPILVLARRTIKLQPEIQALPLPTAIPTISLSVIDSFLTRTRIVSPRLLEQAPYVIGGAEQRIISGAGDRLYARGQAATAARHYGVYRPGRIYHDPDSGEALGLEVLEIGLAELLGQRGEVMTLRLTRSRREARLADRLLPAAQRPFSASFYPAAPELPVEGRIIAVLNGVSQVGQFAVVALNRGEREGLAAGHVLAIHQRGEQVRDPITGEVLQLPPERAGLLMVFRTFEKMSYGIVLQATRPLAVRDEVRNP